MFSNWLNNVKFLKTMQAPFNDIFEPGSRDFPALKLRLPFWLVALIVLEPTNVVFLEWESY